MGRQDGRGSLSLIRAGALREGYLRQHPHTPAPTQLKRPSRTCSSTAASPSRGSPRRLDPPAGASGNHPRIRPLAAPLSIYSPGPCHLRQQAACLCARSVAETGIAMVPLPSLSGLRKGPVGRIPPHPVPALARSWQERAGAGRSALRLHAVHSPQPTALSPQSTDYKVQSTDYSPQSTPSRARARARATHRAAAAPASRNRPEHGNAPPGLLRLLCIATLLHGIICILRPANNATLLALLCALTAQHTRILVHGHAHE